MSQTASNVSAASDITVTSVPLPVPDAAQRYALVVDNVFSKAEMQQWIATVDAKGFERALLNIGYGRQIEDIEVRNSLRCIIDDAAWARRIYDRVRAHIPDVWRCRRGFEWEPVSVNERLRFLRYEPGQYFRPHYDGNYVRNDGSGEESMITIQVYMSEGSVGGATNFLSDGSDLPTASVVPVPGRVLLFEHRLLHEGEEVSAGVKYVVRSDIMFRRRRDQQRWAGAPSGADWVPGAASASASSAASASASTSDSTDEPRTP